MQLFTYFIWNDPLECQPGLDLCNISVKVHPEPQQATFQMQLSEKHDKCAASREDTSCHSLCDDFEKDVLMSSDVVDTQTWCLNCTHSSTVIVSDLAMRGMMLTFSCNRFMNSISRGFSLGRKQRERRSFLKVSPSVHSCGASCGLSVMFHHSADLQRNIWMDQTAEKKNKNRLLVVVFWMPKTI